MNDFTPIVEPAPQTNRKAMTVIVNVGLDRKARFVEYCREHGISQTECLKQMMDHCMGRSENSRPEKMTVEHSE